MSINQLSRESPPSTFPLQFGQLFIFIFVIHLTKSKLVTRSVPVLKLPDKMHYFLFQEYKSVTKKSSICRKYRHKSICINNTQLNTFYCYSATTLWQIYQISSYSSQSLRGSITPQFILFPLYHHPCKKSLIPALSLMSRELLWGQPCMSKVYFLNQCSTIKLTNSEKQNENFDCKL